MKSNVILFIGICLIPLLSCEKKSNSSIIETNTNLKIDIPIKAFINASNVDYSFSGVNSYIASSIDDGGKEIQNIKKIKPHKGSLFSFSGIKEGEKINSLLLEWGYRTLESEDYKMYEPIDLLLLENELKSDVFSVKLDEALINLMDNIDGNQNHSILIRLSGTSNFEINGIGKINIPVLVESEQFNFRFELF